jgi:hypothetical protein
MAAQRAWLEVYAFHVAHGIAGQETPNLRANTIPTA